MSRRRQVNADRPRREGGQPEHDRLSVSFSLPGGEIAEGRYRQGMAQAEELHMAPRRPLLAPASSIGEWVSENRPRSASAPRGQYFASWRWGHAVLAGAGGGGDEGARVSSAHGCSAVTAMKSA